MQVITAKPLNFIDLNHFFEVERADLIQGNAGTYYLQLQADEQRYVPPAGSTLQIKFPRALTIAATPSNQDVTVALSPVSGDGSIYSYSLTVAQVDTIVSGGVKILITLAGVLKTWPVDEFVRRRSNSPGS